MTPSLLDKNKIFQTYMKMNLFSINRVYNILYSKEKSYIFDWIRYIVYNYWKVGD